ncbi:hypothetical protein LINPERHAP1_LOCUS20817 [Linum perenne]
MQSISFNVDHHTPRNKRHINPTATVKNLKASNLILQNNGKETHISMWNNSDCELWLRARWTVMTP